METANGVKVGLHRADSPEEIGSPGIHFDFYIAEVDREYDRLHGGGVAVEGPPKEEPWGGRWIRVRDPDGYEVQLVRMEGYAVRGTALGHVTVWATDMELSKRFYRDIVGLDFGYEDAHYIALKASNDATVGLHAADNREKAASPGTWIDFEVPDVDKEYERLKAMGLSPRPPDDKPWGWRHLHLRDPDGHAVSLFTIVRK